MDQIILDKNPIGQRDNYDYNDDYDNYLKINANACKLTLEMKINCYNK